MQVRIKQKTIQKQLAIQEELEMKKMLVVMIAVLTLMVMVGCGTQTFAATDSVAQKQVVQVANTKTAAQATKQINEAQAKQIAAKHAGFKESDVKFTKVEKDMDDGVMKYDIHFVHGTQKYEYDVRISDGRILEYDIDSVYDD